jgi:hypothetical protein
MKDNRTPAQIQADNFADFLIRGPGLRRSYGTYIVARCPSKNQILIGRLGAMGVGEMWFEETERHRDYSGYDTAEILKTNGI